MDGWVVFSSARCRSRAHAASRCHAVDHPGEARRGAARTGAGGGVDSVSAAGRVAAGGAHASRGGRATSWRAARHHGGLRDIIPGHLAEVRVTTAAMTADPHVFHEARYSAADVNWCSYSRWSPFFAAYTPSATVLGPLPEAFLAYLNSDSIRLPAPKYEPKVVATSDNEYSDWEDAEVQDEPVAGFSEFHRRVEEVVAHWGSVMVKLNWSAPKDARWILLNNSLQCRSALDVYLVLNASDHAAHDLDGHMYDECDDALGERLQPELVVKRWIPNMNPALEFRIFVRGRRVMGVSQRDLNHYEFLADIKPELTETITQFHRSELRSSPFPLENYIMDVYIPRPYNKVVVLDVNPYGRKWNSLLFTWNELLEPRESDAVELRIITETNLGSMARKDHSENQVPIEVVDASLNSDAMVELAKEWHNLEARTAGP